MNYHKVVYLFLITSHKLSATTQVNKKLEYYGWWVRKYDQITPRYNTFYFNHSKHPPNTQQFQQYHIVPLTIPVSSASTVYGHGLAENGWLTSRWAKNNSG